MTTSNATQSVTTKQVIKQTIQNLLSQYFPSTLNTVPDIVNIVMALCQQENSLNPNGPPGVVLSTTTSSGARDYWNSQPVINALAKQNPTMKNNLQDGLRAWGMTQVMGWNIVKGASIAGGGKTIIESSRPDLAPQLMVNPGDSIRDKLFGSANLSNQILAGLIILESKFKAVKGSGTNFTIGKLSFNSKIAAAVAGYYGLSLNANPTPYQYSSSIMYGHSYQIANGPGGGAIASANSNQANPPITIASNNPQAPVGC